MKIINPTDSEITILYKGVTYTVPANGFVLDVPKDAAEYWVNHLHQFLIVEDPSAQVETPIKKEEKVVEKEEVKPKK